MKRLILSFVFLLCFTTISLSQDIRLGKGGTGFETVQNPDWAGDILITTAAPQGIVSAVGRPNGEIFVSVPDTNLTPGFSLRIFKSTNFGDTWTLFPTGIEPGGQVIRKSKMVRTGLDSIYCTFLVGQTLYIWNVESGNFNAFDSTNIKGYDICGSSTGGLYIFAYMDTPGRNDLRRFGSGNGGATWPTAGFVSSSGAYPSVTMSTSGDTIMLNYYGPVLSDTTTSIIRGARYRETTGPGSFGSVGGSFLDIATATTHKAEFHSVAFNGKVWFFYTDGDPPSRDIKGFTSANFGVSYPTPFDLAANPSLDERASSSGIFVGFGDGCDVSFIADSSGAPGPSNNRVLYTSAPYSSPTGFSLPDQISESFPIMQSNTTLVEFGDVDADLGVVWLGENSGTGVYWDRAGAVSGIHNNGQTPGTYALKQNYPNPFNPETNIEFSIPTSGFTSLKVYDIVGREVTSLVASRLEAGSYTVDFNASKLTSGVYFYRIESGSFIETKKMLLVK